MVAGASYSCALEGNTNGVWPSTFTVFIDWNQDGIFDNDTERYDIGKIIGSTGEDGIQAVNSIYVPLAALEGSTRMRVMKKFGETYVPDACNANSNFGQAEDYTIHVVQGVFPEPYCSVEGITTVEPITLVQFAGIDNTAVGTTAHEDFIDLTGEVETGEDYEIILKGDTGGEHTSYFTVFVDWNMNGAFDEDEQYNIGTIHNSTGQDEIQVSGIITIPANALKGINRMRVIKSRGAYAADGCSAGEYGQAHDYSLLVSQGSSWSCFQEYWGIPAKGLNNSENGWKGANDFVVDPYQSFDIKSIKMDVIEVAFYGSGQPTGYEVEVFKDNGSGGVGESTGMVFQFDESNMTVTNLGLYVNVFPHYLVELHVDGLKIENPEDTEVRYWLSVASELSSNGKAMNWHNSNISQTSTSKPTWIYKPETGWDMYDGGLYEGLMRLDGICANYTEPDPTYTVTGVVKNSEGVLPNVEVKLDTKVTTTGSNGVFTFTEVMAGIYNLTINHAGYEPYSQQVNTESAVDEVVDLGDIVLAPTMGILDNVLSNIVIYPNPIDDILYFNSENEIESVRLYNMTGQTVLFIQNHPAQNINVSHLNAGMYMGHAILSNGQILSIKIVKQ
ncbi:MAG: GEVED domain-containing protein [Bacteroidales bacterium]